MKRFLLPALGVVGVVVVVAVGVGLAPSVLAGGWLSTGGITGTHSAFQGGGGGPPVVQIAVILVLLFALVVLFKYGKSKTVDRGPSTNR